MAWTKKDEESILGKNWRRNNPQEKARCGGCFRDFWRDERETWKTLCDSCWIHSPYAKRETRDKVTALLAERENLLKEKDAVQREKAELQRKRDEFKLLKMQYFMHDVWKGDQIPDEMLSKLIRLTHPDRHSNSSASNEATAWLLAQRQKR
jgi:hypothetical protein